MDFIFDPFCVLTNGSTIFIQRPYRHGYDTEYLGWCINESDLLTVAHSAGLGLRREFVVGFNPVITNAPEQNSYRGYLFQRSPAAPAPRTPDENSSPKV